MSGKWLLVRYDDYISKQGSFKPNDQKLTIVLTFNDDCESGKISGHTLTNKIFGDYTILPSNGLKVYSLGGTKIAEHGWGENFWNHIRTSNSFSKNGNTLKIFYEENNKAMVFVQSL
jgi:hypothetical protein